MSKKAKGNEPVQLANFLRGRKIADVVEFAKTMVAGETPRLNFGVFSHQDWDKYNAQRDEALAAGKKAAPPINIYQPAIMEYANSVGALTAFATDTPAKERPELWNDNKLGAWTGGRLGETRLNHIANVRKVIVDPDQNLVTIERLGTFVVGTADTSAIHFVHMSKTGGFYAMHRAAKELGAVGVDGLSCLVGKINEKVVKETLEDGSEIVWLPGQQITWGYLLAGDNILSPEQARTLGHGLGITFKALEAPIRLNNVDPDAFLARVKWLMSADETKDAKGLTDWDRFVGRKSRSGKESKSASERLWANAGTMCRVNPQVIRCNGLKSAQLGLPFFSCLDGPSEASAYLTVAVAVGARLPIKWSENVWKAKARFAALAAVDAAVDAAVESELSEAAIETTEVASAVTA